MRLRIVLLAAATAAALAVPVTATATAATVHGPAARAAASYSCQDRVCINVLHPTSNSVSVRACLVFRPLQAVFGITGPGHLSKKSAIKNWNVNSHHCTGNDKYFSVSWPDLKGKYCAKGDWITGAGGIPIGMPCVVNKG